MKMAMWILPVSLALVVGCDDAGSNAERPDAGDALSDSASDSATDSTTDSTTGSTDTQSESDVATGADASTGGSELDGDGATGTMNGVTYTFTHTVGNTVVNGMVFTAAAAEFGYDEGAWRILNFDFEVGHQSCDADRGGSKGIFLHVPGEGAAPYHAAECEIEITTVGSELGFSKGVAGTFQGTFRRGDDTFTVTDGQFRFTP